MLVGLKFFGGWKGGGGIFRVTSKKRGFTVAIIPLFFSEAGKHGCLDSP